MSVEAITWALKVPVPASSAKFVLVVLANQANDETGRSFPSIKYLSEATGQDRKTVISNLSKLSAWGLVKDSGERVGITKQVIVYTLLRDPDLFLEVSQKRNSSKNGTVPKTDGNSPVFPRKQSQKRDTEPSITSSNRKAKAKRPQAALPDPPAGVKADAWHGFVEMRARSKHPLTAYAAKLVIAELVKHQAQGADPNEMLNNSTRNGWRDVFPPKPKGVSHGTTGKPSLAQRALQSAIDGEQRDAAKRHDDAHALASDG